MSRLSIVLPGLKLAEPEPPVPPNPCPRLGALLARSTVRHESLPLESRLFGRFGHQEAAHGVVPAAAATSLIDFAEPSPGLVRCDPVYVRADPTRLLLFDAAHFELEASDAEALIALLARELPALGLRRGDSPVRWYADEGAPGGWHAWSPREMAGRALSRDLPVHGDARAMNRVLTEVQMVLHETAINQAREARGLPPINGVWPWGGGEVPPALAPPRAAFGNDVLLGGLARAAGIAWHAEAGPTAAISAARRGDVAVALGAPFGIGDRTVPVEPLAAFESDWCPPLARALWRGTFATLELLGETETFTLTRGSLLRLWRKAPYFEWPQAGGV